MPTQNPSEFVTPATARQHVAANVFKTGSASERVGKIGLEPEGFAIRVCPKGGADGRLPLEGAGGILETIDKLAAEGPASTHWLSPRPVDQKPPPKFMMANGGSLTFEPGGQIEHSTKVHDSGALALDDAAEVTAKLTKAFGARGVALAFSGLDLWHDVADVPMQLDAPRYHCMQSYFKKRGVGGRTMMRHTCSMQVNLDLGPPGVAEERWLLSNLVSPLVTATFASSPVREQDGEWAVSGRARAWQIIDETRAGFPGAILDGSSDDPVEQWTQAALSADVMILWKPDGSSTCGVPGFSFRDWIEKGHDEYGYPTLADFEYHLTTLFFEVRLRGFLEMRAPEAVKPRWRTAPSVLLAGLLYDDRARNAALEHLSGKRSQLQQLWERAAGAGLRDAELAELCNHVWPLALEGARRLPEGFFRAEHLDGAARFLDCYTLKGRAPVNELFEAMERSPAEGLSWATSDLEPCADKR